MQVYGIAGQSQSRLLKARGSHPVLQATGTGDQFQVQSVLSVVQQVLYGEADGIHGGICDKAAVSGRPAMFSNPGGVRSGRSCRLYDGTAR